MRLVEKPLPLAPHACLVTGRDDGELVDFEVDVMCNEPPHAYLKREVIEAAAAELGMVKGKDFEELKAKFEALSQQLDEAIDSVNLAAEFEEKFRERITV